MNIDVTKTHVAAEVKHKSPIIACRFDPGGKSVFFGAEDHMVWRWNWTEGDALVPFRGHNSWVRAIACTPDSQTLITGGYDGQLVWWPALDPKPQPSREVAAHDGWIRALAVSPDGKWVGSVGNDHSVRVWNVADGQLVMELIGHDCHVYNLSFHPHDAALVSGDLKANLIHWDISTGKEVRRWQAKSLYTYDKGFRADIGGFRGLLFSPCGKRLAGSGMVNVTNAFAGVGEPAVVEFDWESEKELVQHESKAKLKGVAWGVAVHPDEFTIGVSGGGAGGYLLFWKPIEKEEFHQFKLPNTARDLDMSNDGIHLATAHYDRRVRICRMTAKT
jgi:WD40 repeat protein